MENIFLALQLMVVGMTTVFLILSIIIGLGKGLVSFSNWLYKRYPSLEQAPPLTHQTPAPATEIDNQTKQILQCAIDELTHHKGHITGIKKL